MDIHWKLNLRSSPDKVFSYLTTDEGRMKFWTEKSEEKGGYIYFTFINGQNTSGKILKKTPPKNFSFRYFDSTVHILLKPSENGGTILDLLNQEVSDSEFTEVNAGWVSVLMALKAVIDYGVDLRNHDPRLSWDQGFVDN